MLKTFMMASTTVLCSIVDGSFFKEPHTMMEKVLKHMHFSFYLQKICFAIGT